MSKKQPARSVTTRAPRWFRRRNARYTFATYGIKKWRPGLRERMREWIAQGRGR